MPKLRRLATVGTAGLVALTVAAPAPAASPPKGTFDVYAQIDCGSGPIEVGSGADLWSTLVDIETGRKYEPIAWNVSGEGFSVVETRSEPKERSAVCSYDDGVATGTVTVKKA